MALRFALTRLLPTLLLFLALLASALAVDYVLHRAGLLWVGRYLGLCGSVVIISSFAYSARKRKLFQAGTPKTLLAAHELLGWTGALMLLVHGGVHFNALVPWLALGSMLAVVASGLTGKYLLQQARVGLAERVKELARAGVPAVEIDRELLGRSLLVATMQKWRKIHMPLTMVFAGLALVHIVATVFFGRWLP